MKTLLNRETVVLPKGVSSKINGRKVEIKGPRGTLKRDFSHMQISIVQLTRKSIQVSVYFAKRRNMECLNTTCSHIKNMIKGVTLGIQFKLRLVYAHYPIQLSSDDVKNEITIKNYIGQKRVRSFAFPEGVKVYNSKNVKDEVIVEGNDLADVSLTAARIRQVAAVKGKDIRKFLDGIYITDRTTVQQTVSKKPDAKKGGKDTKKKIDKTKLVMKKVTSGGGKNKKKKWSKGKMRDKLENASFVDQATLDKIYKEVPKMAVSTPAAVSDKYKLKVSVARRVLNQMVANDALKLVQKSGLSLICTKPVKKPVAAVPE